MRLLINAIIVLTCTGLHAQQQDTTRIDSTSASYRLPGMPALSVRATSHAVIAINLRDLRQTNTGITLVSNLRGNIPNMSLDPSYQAQNLTWRNSRPVMVIDGISFNQDISGFYNLNTFEYDRLSMVLSRNGSVLFGGTGAGGVLVASSRSGEGIAGPQVEVNSYTTYSWDNTYGTNQWQYSNSIAYAQDFGKVDTRVSFNINQLPAGTNTVAAPDQFNLKINTGITLDRFSARLILTGLLGQQSISSQYPRLDSTSIVRTFVSHTDKHTVQENLMLRYEFTKWLSASAQLSNMTLSSEYSASSGSLSYSNSSLQTYNGGNLMVHISTNDRKTIVLSASTGVAYSENAYDRVNYLTYDQIHSVPGATTSYLAALEASFRKHVYLGVNLRSDHFKSDFHSDQDNNAWSVFGNYHFSHLLDPSGRILSSSKIRTSYGFNYNPVDYTIPGTPNTAGSIHSGLPSRSFEAGLDATLFRGVAAFSFNYFDNKLFYEPEPVPTDPPTGYTIVYSNSTGDYSTRGLEFLLNINALHSRATRITTQVLVGTYTEQFVHYPSGRVTTFGGGAGGYSPYPAWTASWLNRITWKRFYLSFLFDVSSGKKVYALSGLQDLSFTRLREISVGFELPGLGWKKGFISLTGRNLAVFNSTAPFDPEANPINPSQTGPIKSFSLNLSLVF